ncbi:MAG: hypothetical protein A2Z32_14025 [Chloroflexi bacterium RBG_16_69_14]|nr:MAG: hypothetical protein A2Z32_14025 [Chloroflexi bacterium RBG_16_69_14]
MDQTTILVLLVGAAVVGILATVAILNRDRMADADASRENPYATATEGMKRCPACGVGNLVTDDTCSACGKPLPR